MIRRPKHKYFDNDADHSIQDKTGISEVSGTSNCLIKQSRSSVTVKSNQQGVEEIDNTQKHNFFQKQFEATYGYVKKKNRYENVQRNFFPKKSKRYLRYKHKNTKLIKANTNIAINENWFNGRYGVSQDESPMKNFTHKVFSENFPNDLVAYLRSIAVALEGADSETAVFMKKKSLEECMESTVLLLSFESSCRVVEQVFDGYQPAASIFHRAVLDLSEDQILEALLTGSSCRTLESMLYSLSTAHDHLIFTKWTEVIVGSWDYLLSDNNASHFIRSLLRTMVRLPKRESFKENVLPDDLSLRKRIVKAFNANCPVKNCFLSIANAALDFLAMKDRIDTESISLILQEVVEYDWLVKGEKRRDFLLESLEDPNIVLKQWKSKYGSHFWQVLVKRIDEDARQMLYHTVIGTNLSQLAQDSFACYVVDAFVSAANSQELVTDVFDEFWDAIPDLCDNGKWQIVTSLVLACADHEDTQKSLIKKLRRYFFCSKKSEKKVFVAKVFTMQMAKIEIMENGKVQFDVKFGDHNGSKLLQELFKLKRNSTVTTSLKSLSDKTLLDLALNEKGTFLLQGFLKSPTVSLEDKLNIGDVMKRNWSKLIGDHFGSFVFDALWDSGAFSLETKRAVMSELCLEQAEGKSGRWRLMAKKLNVRGFRESRANWLKAERLRIQTLLDSA